MAFTALQTIQLRAPQWSTDPRLVSLIALAKQGMSETVFGARYGEAVGLKVLHWLAKESMAGGDPGTGSSSGSGATGQITSEKEGQLSRSFADLSSGSGGGVGGISAGMAELQTTGYGRELIQLIQCTVFNPINRTV